MYKFFVEEKQMEETVIHITGEDVNHIKNVLRLTVGEEIEIGNKQTAQNFKCEIIQIETSEITAQILEPLVDTREAKTGIHLFQGLPKADKFEWIIEKCTEIGVKEITPVIMKRTIVNLNQKDQEKKMARWQKIAEVAAKQSKRDTILKVNFVINFEKIFEIIKNYDIVLVAYEKEKNNTLKSVLKTISKKENLKIAVIIGPEGGIEEQELESCLQNQVIPVSLGKRILRTETAPIVIASNILYELED